MRIKFVFLIVFVFSVSIPLFSAGEVKKSGVMLKEINPKDAAELIKENADNPDFVILDVRTKSEFNEGHLAHAVNLDFYDKEFGNQLDSLDKDKKYFVYCRSGNRSGKTAGMMKNLGFKEIYSLSGGFSDLKKTGLKTE